MDDAFQIVIVILLYIIGMAINRFAKGRQDKDMQELAARLSLEYIEGGLMRSPRVAGLYDGQEVMIENVLRARRGSREQKAFFRIITHSEVPIPDSIRVHNALSFGPVTDLFSEIGEFFGIRDIPFDNSVFNDKFVIRGRNEALVKMVLNEEAQEALIGISRVNLVIQDDEIIYEDEGKAPENESRIRTILTLQKGIANRIGEIVASGGIEMEKEEAPRDIFKPKPAPVPAAFRADIPPEPEIQTVPVQGRVIRELSADIVPARSDYYPVAPLPEQLVRQLKREGYYGGD
jgi:hypothetical protein